MPPYPTVHPLLPSQLFMHHRTVDHFGLYVDGQLVLGAAIIIVDVIRGSSILLVDALGPSIDSRLIILVIGLILNS